MLNFDEREEAKMEQEAFAIAAAEQASSLITVPFELMAKAAQYEALLMTLRTAACGERYDLASVALHVVSVFNELEGAGC